MTERRSGRTIVLQGPIAGMLFGVVLGVGAFLVAVTVRNWMIDGPQPVEPPPGFVLGGDPRDGVRVLAGEWAPGVAALLVPLRDDGAGADEQERLLNAALFPDQGPVRWGRILVCVPDDSPAVDVDLGAGAVRLAENGVVLASADLAGVFARRRGELAAHRRFELEVLGADRRVHRVEPGAALRALLAFPGAVGPAEADWAETAAGRRLEPARVTTESLRTAESANDPSRLRPADTAEVRAPGGGGSR